MRVGKPSASIVKSAPPSSPSHGNPSFDEVQIFVSPTMSRILRGHLSALTGAVTILTIQWETPPTVKIADDLHCDRL